MSESIRRPRDAKATQALLLKAATAEFAEYGLAGARIDRIAERAGANKRLIYVYFGDKDKLFDAVLQGQIEAIAENVPLTPDDLPAFAAARFDYVLANPQTARLAAWRTFERATPTEPERESYDIKVQAIAEAQRAGKVNDTIPAIDLFAMVLRISESWLSGAPGLKALAEDTPARLQEHRKALIQAVQSFTAPRSGGGGR